MNKIIVVLLLIVVVGGGAWYFSNDKEEVMDTVLEEDAEGVPQTASVDTASKMNEEAPSAASEVRSFTVTGRKFKFSLGEIKVKKGETVEIRFVNEEGQHDWKIDEFKAATKILSEGKEETVRFVVDKTGTFEYYCSVGTHRQMGMKGNLIVE